MKHRWLIIATILVFITHIGFADSDTVSVRATPGARIPVGASANYFTAGIASDVVAEIRLPTVPLLYIPVNLTYSYLPIDSETADLTLMVIDIGAGAGVDWNPGGILHVGGYARAGFAFGFIPDPDNTLPGLVVNPVSSDQTWNVTAGLFTQMRLMPALSVGLEGSYTLYGGLYSGIDASLGLTYHIQPKKEPEFQIRELDFLNISSLTLDPVFPVFYKYYDSNTFGTVTVRNIGSSPIQNLELSFQVKEYMDNPKMFTRIDRLEPGDEQTVEVTALFNKDVLTITESTLLSATVSVESDYAGERYRNQIGESLRVYDRNALTWADDRRAAAFVTNKDPSVLKLSKYVTNQITDQVSGSLNNNLLIALGLLEALRLTEFSYVIDPSSAYIEQSKQPLAIDYVQFPVQTLQYKSGDCDDLSILYCALLESVGIRTAFITIPGHIYMALDLGITRDRALDQFDRPEDLIFDDEQRAWLPVEVTALRDGFLEAWRIGAQQWREFAPASQARFYPLSEASALYEAVGFSSEVQEIDLPEEQKFRTRFIEEVERFVDREIQERVEQYQQVISERQGRAKDVNRLGVLYARYGKLAEAKQQFEAILAVEEYLPALLNLGNVLTLQGEYEQALEHYEDALDIDPGHPSTLLALARTHHTLENYSFVRKYYDRLVDVDPALAEKYEYLRSRKEEADRAANFSSEREAVEWDD